MATPVIMPKVDMVMETGTLVEWLKKEGEYVRKGEPLFIIMTEKANMEIESPANGILAGLRAKPGQVVPVTEVIAYLLEPGETLPGQSGISIGPMSTAQLEKPTLEQVSRPKMSGNAEKVRATPAARRLATELGVDLHLVQGTGPSGRIQKEDVLAYRERRQAIEVGKISVPPGSERPMPRIVLPSARRKGVLPLTGPRKIIAERMSYSAFTAPHIVLTLTVNMREVVRMYERLSEPIQQRTGLHLSYTAILACAVATVLPRHPFLNATLNGEEIILWEDVDLGIATAVEDYLVVPVLRQAQQKDLEEIVVELNDLVERARGKRLTPSEMSGSTFTISNLGMFGIEQFQAIINPPEVAILAVGKITEMPVNIEGDIQLSPIIHLTLSADHRVVDGLAGARFLTDLKGVLENPYLLI